MATTLLGHPSGAREVAFERYPRAVGLGVWVDAQHDPTDFTPVGALLISIKHAHVHDHVLLVIISEDWSVWRYISDLRIELRLFHTCSRFLTKRVRKNSCPQ